MIYGYDPIYLEKIEVNKWLEEDDDNFLLVLEDSKNKVNISKSFNKKDKIFCLKKSYIQTPGVKDIFVKCITSNGQILPKKSYMSKTIYFYIGNYIYKPVIVNLKDINSTLLDYNVYKLKLDDENFDYINREMLALSNIGLFKDKLTPSQIKKLPKEEQELIKKSENDKEFITKLNMPHGKEVYFERILAKALKDYSYQWDVPVNTYLRLGEDYFKSNIFKKHYKQYGETMETSIDAVKNKIADLDRVFLDAAPRNESETKTYYRGMTQIFEGFNLIGDSMVVKNFLSVSSSFEIAVSFSGIKNGNKCCLYKIIIDKGIPTIDMVSTTVYTNEKETLLPRNLDYELIDIIKISYPRDKPKYTIPIYVMKATLIKKDQFKVKNVCQSFTEGKLEIYKNPPFIKRSQSKSPKTKKAKAGYKVKASRKYRKNKL
tara:strand:+ start:105 stop:1397 length:1293 start_codon:yes stop_codon:yes gene_type:complete